MAKTKISEYDATAANNTDIDSINIAEGMAPSNVNNAIRQMMAHLKDMDAGTQALTSPQLSSVDINGGTIDGVTIGGASAGAGTFTAVSVDNITIDGTEIDCSADMTIDVNGDLSLDVSGGDVRIKADGAQEMQFKITDGANVDIIATVQDDDIRFRGNTSSGTITALTLDMSEAGTAIFNNKVGIGTTSPAAPLDIGFADNSNILRGSYASGEDAFFLELDSKIVTSGVVGYQFHLTNNSTAYNNTLTLDRGNVGIGVESASAKFHVDSGSTDTVALFESSSDANAYLVVKDSGSSGGAFFGANGTSTIIGTGGSTTRMTIDSSGRVGIAQDTPGDFSSSADDLVVGNSSGARGITVRSSASSSGNLFFADGTSGNQAYRGYVQYSHDLDRLNLGAGGDDRVIITSTGNVGIGTNSPDAPLEIEGDNSSTTQFSGYSGLRIHNANGSAHGITAEMYFTAGTAGSNRGAAIGSQFTSAASGNDLYFATNGGNVTSSDTLTERMRINSSGDVGIGEDSPTSRLVVKKQSSRTNSTENMLKIEHTSSGTTTTGFGSTILFSGERNGGTVQNQGQIGFVADVNTSSNLSSAFVINTGESGSLSEKFRVSSGGDVGIGMTPDTAVLLSVSGAVGPTNGSNSAPTHTFYSDPDTGMYRAASDTLAFSTGGAEAMRIDSSGNVIFGAGAAVPSSSAGGAAFDPNTNGRMVLKLGTTNTGNQGLAEFFNPNGKIGDIVVNGSATAFNTSSDYRLKENVAEMTGATARLKQLKPKRFNFIVDADTTVDGFLAHEVSAIVPEAITGTKDEVDGDGNPVMQGIDQSKLVPLLVKTIQELEARITALEGA